MYKVNSYQRRKIHKVNIRNIHAGDIMCLDGIAIRIVEVKLNGLIGYCAFKADGSYLTAVHGLEAVAYIRANDKRLEDIKISEEILLKNGFQDISIHSLKGACTFSFTSPKDLNHQITLKVDDWIDCTYFDGSLFHNLQTVYASTLRQLQHALDEDGFDLLLKP